MGLDDVVWEHKQLLAVTNAMRKSIHESYFYTNDKEHVRLNKPLPFSTPTSRIYPELVLNSADAQDFFDGDKEAYDDFYRVVAAVGFNPTLDLLENGTHYNSYSLAFHTFLPHFTYEIFEATPEKIHVAKMKCRAHTCRVLWQERMKKMMEGVTRKDGWSPIEFIYDDDHIRYIPTDKKLGPLYVCFLKGPETPTCGGRPMKEELW